MTPIPTSAAARASLHLNRLIERVEATGVRTHIRVGGANSAACCVRVVAYQVVQEALTNVVKHAGAGATAEVRVSTAADTVTVEVTNTAGAGAQPLSHSGQGLLGMTSASAHTAATWSSARGCARLQRPRADPPPPHP